MGQDRAVNHICGILKLFIGKSHSTMQRALPWPEQAPQATL